MGFVKIFTLENFDPLCLGIWIKKMIPEQTDFDQRTPSFFVGSDFCLFDFKLAAY